ncbi:serine/threonine-protein kinase [Haloferula rosea]|uniref:Serine/threonine protein kinase n=1 Tax=Haloferula rosea TaxID=490093 RepID=A0A934R817_9BACT|nr:serine/threonine-protein kinase [Haloferula rosea]MBK1825610.1 serine/threonine protein kinase [Haloferula rosea]
MSAPEDREFQTFTVDHRLADAYFEANELDDNGLEALCPSFVTLSEAQSGQRYHDESPLGLGSLKEVSSVWDASTRRRVAFARLREDRGPEFYDLFVNEAWITSSLSHPNIIKVYDVGVDEDKRPYFTMDLKGKSTLADLIRMHGMEERPRLIDAFLKVCDAIAYAHTEGILHLDLKPENIQAERFGEVLVCDWGLAKTMSDSGTDEDELPFPGQTESIGNMTIHGEVKGTPGFMAPEQLRPGAAKDQRTDVFALGCLLHCILTGLPPITGTTQEEIIRKTGLGCFPPPRLRFPEKMIPDSLDAIILKACSLEPNARYPSATEMADDIRKHLAGFATEAEEPSFYKASILFLRRHRLPAAVGLIATVAISVISVLFIQGLNDQRRATAAQAQRAERLEGEASQMADRLREEAARAGRSSKELAEQLSSSAIRLKNLGIFDTPVSSIEESAQLTELALAFDPQNQEAIFQLFSLNCLKLDFSSALKSPPSAEHRFGDYLQFAEAFPRFNYDRGLRPSPAMLADFFRRAREINPRRGPLMERILSYDVAARRDFRNAEPAIAFLEYLHGGPEHIIAAYQSKERSLFIWSDQSVHLRRPVVKGYSGKSFLRFLPTDLLRLDLSEPFDLATLDQADIHRLNLKDCADLRLSRPISLPMLETIELSEKQDFPQEWLRQIQSRRELKLIRTPGQR